MKYLIFDAGPIISLTMNGMREEYNSSRSLRLWVVGRFACGSLSLVGGKL